MKTKTFDPQITQKVLEMVANHYKTTPEVLRSDEGDQTAKKVVMYIIREGIGGSIRSAKDAVGKKHDNDVYMAIRKVKELMGSDAALDSLVEEIKTEAIMIAALPSGDVGTTGPTSPSLPPTPRPQRTAVSPERTETLVTPPPGSASQNIANVQKAVTGVFLGANLLQSPDPAAEVMLAKDVVVFLVWDDFPKIPLHEILSTFRLDMDGFYRAIGKTSVRLKEEGGELKKKIRAARGAYPQAV